MKHAPHTEDDKTKRKINIPSVDLPKDPLTRPKLDKDLRERIDKITQEFREGFAFIRKHPKSVTVFGSARFDETHEYYQKARDIAYKIADAGYDVMTGGGPGIMEGANRGAQEAQNFARSIGFNIELPMEQVENDYVDDGVSFYYFFARKVALTFSAEAYLFFPGGFGTLDEFFEIVTLVQTDKIERVPIICVGEDFWGRVDTLFEEMLLDDYRTISPEDRELYTITEDVDEILDIVVRAPMREE